MWKYRGHKRPDFAAVPGDSVCEWKGAAKYWYLSSTAKLAVVGWSYPDPSPAFEQNPSLPRTRNEDATQISGKKTFLSRLLIKRYQKAACGGIYKVL